MNAIEMMTALLARGATMTQRERAEEERRIRDALAPVPYGQERSDVFRRLGSRDAIARRRLLGRGVGADPIWGRLEQEPKVSVAEAARVFDQTQSAESTLKQLNERAETRWQRGIETRRLRVDKWVTRTQSRKREQVATPHVGSWDQIRALVRGLVSSTGADPAARMALECDFTAELMALVRDQQLRLRRSANGPAAEIRRRAFTEACQVLSLVPPRPGKPLGAFGKQAQRQMYKFARLYHPDMNGGDDRKREMYEAAIAAAQTIRAYVEAQTNHGGTHASGSQ